MKKLFILVLSLLFITEVFSQSQGISYQAVIISTSNQEIPGNDISGNIIPNRDIMVRFSILDASGSIEYQEEQATRTDAYGMINLIIGQGTVTATSPLTFTEIDWNGTPKDLKVDISLNQTDKFYTDFSLQQLNFIPYAYHKNITATGSLKVDGKSTLQDLSVEATTNLNGSLDVNNASPTNLTGSLRVEDNTTLEKKLTVNSTSNLNGQVTINASVSGGDASIDAYPLIVKGSDQGIAIKVNNKRSNSTNFVTFWDNEKVQGRIEGESTDDITSDPWFYFENAKLVVETGVAAANLYAAVTATTVCAGLGACVAAPPPSKIVFGIAQVVVRAAQLAAYDYFRLTNAGVVYKSKGADYAEYLPKMNPNENIFPGDIVGIRGGSVSKSTQDADKIMIVSKKPIVLGNLPKEGDENSCEKIAFIGQVEAKVIGKVNAGDYIIPSGNNDGTGIAISPDDIQFDDYLKIAGVAWSSSQSNDISFINVAVGLNTTDVARLSIRQEKKIKEQEKEIQTLKAQLDKMNAVLAQVIPNYADLMDYKATESSKLEINPTSQTTSNKSSDSSGELTVVYFDITKEQIQQGIEMAKEILKEQDGDLTKYTLFTKLDSDASFKEAYIRELLSSIKKKMDECYNRDLKSGANVVKYY
ncbi:hypothetical protein CYCD_13040 [Tenuifilaceae bacterium CYCD]|nr:hypothetical protein CYCD_13040 [Tenuifilaceae bacterium CYCD]